MVHGRRKGQVGCGVQMEPQRFQLQAFREEIHIGRPQARILLGLCPSRVDFADENDCLPEDDEARADQGLQRHLALGGIDVQGDREKAGRAHLDGEFAELGQLPEGIEYPWPHQEPLHVVAAEEPIQQGDRFPVALRQVFQLFLQGDLKFASGIDLFVQRQTERTLHRMRRPATSAVVARRLIDIDPALGPPKEEVRLAGSGRLRIEGLAHHIGLNILSAGILQEAPAQEEGEDQGDLQDREEPAHHCAEDLFASVGCFRFHDRLTLCLVFGAERRVFFILYNVMQYIFLLFCYLY